MRAYPIPEEQLRKALRNIRLPRPMTLEQVKQNPTLLLCLERIAASQMGLTRSSPKPRRQRHNPSQADLLPA
jgi:hypothetical protein